MKKLLLLIFITLILASCAQEEDGSEQPREDNNKQEMNNSQNEEVNNEQEVNDTQNGATKPLTRSDSEKILNQYKDTFLNIAKNTNKKGKVANYNSKEELISHFTTVMSSDLAEWYMETYFKEENDQLFLKAMDAPTWFVNAKPYTLKKINEQKYDVIQERNNELLGHVNMIYKLSFKNEKWIVNSIDLEHLEPNNKTSETTITEKEAIAAVRQSLEISKESNTKVEFDHRDEDGNYVIHVYDIVEREDGSHTATIGWYIVDKNDGKVENMMEQLSE